MPVMGPGEPDSKEVDEALGVVLELLGDQYGCLQCETRGLLSVELREERVQALREAIFGMLELELWEGF